MSYAVILFAAVMLSATVQAADKKAGGAPKKEAPAKKSDAAKKKPADRSAAAAPSGDRLVVPMPYDMLDDLADEYDGKAVRFKARYLSHDPDSRFPELEGLESGRVFIDHQDTSSPHGEAPPSLNLPPSFALSIAAKDVDRVNDLKKGDVMEIVGVAKKVRKKVHIIIRSITPSK